MRILTVWLSLLLVLALVGCSENQFDYDNLPLYSKVYAPGHDPEADLHFAIDNAQKTNRRILMMVGGDWCPWCRALDNFLQQDEPELNQFLHENFVLLKVFYGRENYNRDFLSGFSLMTATPHFYILESDGSPIYSQPTEVLEKGRSYDALKFRTFLQEWVPTAGN